MAQGKQVTFTEQEVQEAVRRQLALLLGGGVGGAALPGLGGFGQGALTGALGQLQSVAAPQAAPLRLPQYEPAAPPLSPSFGPGGPVLNFTGGSPFPAQDRSRQVLAGLVTGARVLEVLKAKKPPKPAGGGA